MDVKDRADEVVLMRSQKENSHELSYYNGQLEELNRILEKSKLFWGIDETEINKLYETLQPYELRMKDSKGTGFQGVVNAFDIDHAKHKAEREYPDYRLVGVKRA
ncbi:MAG: hypothetical protein K0S39_818 [Paenibacillus sp.]|nr:hypothetical protein [Paenibacillus sp.]